MSNSYHGKSEKSGLIFGLMMLKQILMSIPAGRMGDPIDIANAAALFG